METLHGKYAVTDIKQTRFFLGMTVWFYYDQDGIWVKGVLKSREKNDSIFFLIAQILEDPSSSDLSDARIAIIDYQERELAVKMFNQVLKMVVVEPDLELEENDTTYKVTDIFGADHVNSNIIKISKVR